MLYYVKSGDIDTSLSAKSHLQAALMSLKDRKDFGLCTIVSRREIIKEDGDDGHVYFLTDSILEKPNLRLVR